MIDSTLFARGGTSKPAASRRFVALSATRLAEWLASGLSALDLLVIQIHGLHIGNDSVLVAALGIDAEEHKHPLGLTENASVVQALMDNLSERGLDPTVCQLFIIDGAKALSKVVHRTFGAHPPIQRCQIHKARNVTERLPKPLHASVRRALRQVWELDDALKPNGCCASGQRIPSIESLPALAGPQSCACSPSNQVRRRTSRRQRRCRVASSTAMPASPISAKSGVCRPFSVNHIKCAASLSRWDAALRV